MGRAGGLKSTYDIMEGNSDLRKYYAKSLAKVQVEFVKYLPARVKDLIRLLKYWKYSKEVFDFQFHFFTYYLFEKVMFLL